MLPAASGGDFAPTAEQDSGRRLILGAQRVNGSAEQDVVVQVEVRGEGWECEAWSTQGSNGSWARLVVGGGGGPPCRRAELPLVPHFAGSFRPLEARPCRLLNNLAPLPCSSSPAMATSGRTV